VIRCYDGSVSNGSLKFTLRIPPPPTGGTSSSSSSFGGDQEAANNDPIRKLVFASSSSGSSSSSSRYLCALREYTILVYDLERGVVSHTLNIRDDLTGSSGGKKGRKSSISGNDQTKAIVCDAALTDDDDQLCVLVLFPSSGEGGGKCRIYQYDLTAAAADSSSGLKRKIKVGSVSATSGDQLPSFGVAVSSSSSDKKGERVIAIRMNDGLRVCDYHSGEKLCKSTIPVSDGGAVISSLRLSTCSRYLSTATKNQIVVYKIGNEQDDGKKKSSLQMVAQLSCKDDSTISHVELVKKKDGLTVLAFQPVAATASLFSCDDGTSSFDSSLPPQLPKAQLQCDQGSDSKNIALIHSAFHSRRPTEEILVLFQNITSKGSNASLPMQSISYDDSIEGTVTVGAELSAEIANDANNKKKRKAAASVALAPGDQGNEASLAVDLTSKKARKEEEGEGSEEDDGNFQIDDEDEGGEQGQTIAERLALLSSAMAESDDEEDDDDEEEEEDGKDAAASKKSKFKLKSATSETLTTLLAQALSSNDSVQLNIALQVTDRRLVEGTVRSLQALDAERVQNGESGSSTGYMSMLMGHIVRRMARRHSLVVPLGVWVKAILAATSRAATNSALHPNRDGVEEQIAKEAREIALKLGPLRNFLNERVECFPQLLRLEGRLALLSEQL